MTPVSFEDWIGYQHYEEIPVEEARELYEQEKAYWASLEGVTLKEIAQTRIREFTTALKKYMI